MKIQKTKLFRGALAATLALSLATAPVLADASGFSDVPAGAWFAEEVDWAIKSEITSGVGDNRFDPQGEVTRAQAVTFLWRMAGTPAPTATVSFADVEAGSWYETAVQWAVEEGIVKGTGENQFSPDVTCDRAMCLTMLYRMMGSPLDEAAAAAPVEADPENMTLEDLGTILLQEIIKTFRSPTVFPDVAEGAYYELPVIWGGIGGILTDDNTGTMQEGVTFRPTDPCVRAEMVSFLYQTSLMEEAANAPILYSHGPITIAIPQEYDDLLYRQDYGIPDDADGVLVRYSEKASRDAAEAMGEDPDETGAGMLFAIERVSEERMREIVEVDFGGEDVFAKDANGKYYVYVHPTDVRLVRETNEQMAEAADQWAALNEWAFNHVRDGIIANSEGLTAV